MTADQLITYLSWAIFFLLFVVTAVQAVRRPSRASIDIAILFALPALLVVLNVAGPAGLGWLQRGPLLTGVQVIGLLGMVYMLLRLVDDFIWIPRSALLVAEVGLAVVAVASFFVPQPLPAWYSLLVIAYLIIGLAYTVVTFLRASRSARGVTMRRMRSVAAGSLALGLVFTFAALGLLTPAEWRGFWSVLSELAGLTAAVAYFLGFAPPGILRRAWQEPELRGFLSQAVELSRLPDTESILRTLEAGAAQSVGAPHALVGLWDESRGVLRFTVLGETVELVPDNTKVIGRAFLRQEVASSDLRWARASGAYPELGGRLGARSIMAAPITAGDRRVGALGVYASRAPIFADEDLGLVNLLARQAAVVLEMRSLIDEAAQARAREEAARMKEDFLSAAAHDLKTPLTTLVAQAQLLERKAQNDPSAPADIPGLKRIVRETIRLRSLVIELLDAARAEQGKLVGEREPVDLAEYAREVAERHDSSRHSVSVEAEGDLTGLYDPGRIAQLLENLVENAVKYSPDGGTVRVHLWREGGWNHLSVTDRGIGIPPDELPRVFSRFYRGTNVDDRRFWGMGLGLFICKAIAEQHGGTISVTSMPGKGSTFNVQLPAAQAGRDFGEEDERAGAQQATGEEVA
ncbi:MAG TPA: ATP-binding protein [Chloroflexia bacterium]|nr:ATP-binding protein [Chloroflexia bacterium]